MLDIKLATLKSSDESVFGLPAILNATILSGNEINQVTALAIDIYHSILLKSQMRR